MVFDARYPFTHYGITNAVGSKFVVSQDGGFTWANVASPFIHDEFSLNALAIDPQLGRIFLGTRSGLYRSGNVGSVWAKTSLQDVDCTSIDFGGVPPAVVAGTAEGLVNVTDRGRGISKAIDLRDASANVVAVAVDPSDPKLIYAAVLTPPNLGKIRGRVYRSTNGGASWERLEGDDNTRKAEAISVDAGGTIYATSEITRKLYRRGRDDARWTEIPLGDVSAVTADPKRAGTAFVAEGSLLRTRDGGVTFQTVLSPAARRAIIDPSDSRWVYAIQILHQGSDWLLRSGDGGDSWTTLLRTPPDSETEALVIAPSNGAVLYRSAYVVDFKQGNYYDVERSDDRGATWHRLPLPRADSVRPIVVDPRNERSVWVAIGTSILHSTDGGATWQNVDTPFLLTTGATSMVFDPTGHVLHVLFPEHGVWELTPD